MCYLLAVSQLDFKAFAKQWVCVAAATGLSLDTGYTFTSRTLLRDSIESVGEMSTGPMSRRTGRRLPTQSTRTVSLPDIQGLRAIAVLAVIAYHAGATTTGGFAGVDVFFVISGFVISAMLGREHARSGRIDLSAFYLRRFKRLTPALALVVASVGLLGIPMLSPFGPQQASATTGIASILVAANAAIQRSSGGYFAPPAEANALLHTWSLSVEEQFYLFFPALLAVALPSNARTKWRKLARIALGVTCALSVLLAVAPAAWTADLPGPASLLGFYSPVTRAWEFAVGAALASFARRQAVTGIHVWHTGQFLGLALLAVTFSPLLAGRPFPSAWTLIPVAGTALLLPYSSTENAPISRYLGAGWLAWIGDRSYSLYLWHWPGIVFAEAMWPDSEHWPAVVGAAISVVPALASHRWVETPIRNWDLSEFRNRKAQIATVAVAPLVACTILAVGAEQAWGSAAVEQVQRDTMTFHTGSLRGCADRFPLSDALSSRCIWHAAAPGAPVYLLGDSHADQLSEAAIDATARTNHPLHLATAAGCPFVQLAITDRRTNANNATCDGYVSDSLDFLAGASPGVVIIANSDVYWSSSLFSAGANRMSQTTGTVAKTAAFAQGLKRTVKFLTGAGHSVILVQSTPRWTVAPVWDPAKCSTLRAVARACEEQVPLQSVRRRAAAERAAVSLAAGVVGASVWDPTADLCPNQTCSTTGERFTRYLDSNHISARQSNALGIVLAGILTRLDLSNTQP